MELAEKMLRIDRLLAGVYGETFPYFSERDPLSELINSLLSHRTQNKDSRQAYLRLVAKFPSWEAVRDADTAAVEEAIQEVTYPEMKAPRMQEILRLLTQGPDGKMDLEFLADWPVPEARAWLEKLPGVGAKTSAATLNFSHLRKPALVVDTHHLRVAQRTGLLPPKMDIAKGAYRLQDMMPAGWDAQQVYDHHQRFMRHGQKVCFWQKPDCAHCAIRLECNYFLQQKAATQAVRSAQGDKNRAE